VVYVHESAATPETRAQEVFDVLSVLAGEGWAVEHVKQAGYDVSIVTLAKQKHRKK